MGFFSRKCEVCGESVKAPYDIPEELEWQTKIVVILPDGVMMGGDYDGYGRIITDGIVNSTPFELPKHGETQADWYHDRCHEAAGNPGRYTGGSEDAEDQGFFYDRGGE